MLLTFESAAPEMGGAYTFTFVPHEPISWIAGQSIKIEVPGPYGPLEHRFSISSAPYEGKIAITTRLSGSPYKNSLTKLKAGDTVKAYGLEGDFIWRDSNVPIIFMAAGIGITPFHAILKQRAYDNTPIPVTLFYSSRYDDILFKPELDAWQAARPEFTVNYVKRLTAAPHSIDPHSLIYVSGPSAMVDDLGGTLLAQGVPQSQLLRDWFTGKMPTEG